MQVFVKQVMQARQGYGQMDFMEPSTRYHTRNTTSTFLHNYLNLGFIIINTTLQLSPGL